MIHTANTISCTAISMVNKANGEVKPLPTPKMPNNAYNNANTAPINPQRDNHRGISLDLYNN